MEHIKTTSIIKCPVCGKEKEEKMPTNKCMNMYICTYCGAEITPKDGDCCVFCSYGDTPCPDKQSR